jgi:hypothetical protein
MGGGGKGGGQTQVTEIPKWLEEPTVRNIARAEQVQQMEYQPWTGLDVAAQTPQQQMANQMGLNTASAFGMTPAGYGNVNASSGLPPTQTIGGVTGYSSLPMYDQALAEARARDPRSAQIRNTLYTGDTGYRPKGV